MGLVDGRTVLNYINIMSDETRPSRPCRWSCWLLRSVGRTRKCCYEDAAQYLIKELEGFGLEVNEHRYEYTSLTTGQQNVESTTYVDTDSVKSILTSGWCLVHISTLRHLQMLVWSLAHTRWKNYGTRVGAYDNTAERYGPDRC